MVWLRPSPPMITISGRLQLPPRSFHWCVRFCTAGVSRTTGHCCGLTQAEHGGDEVLSSASWTDPPIYFLLLTSRLHFLLQLLTVGRWLWRGATLEAMLALLCWPGFPSSVRARRPDQTLHTLLWVLPCCFLALCCVFLILLLVSRVHCRWS